MLIHHQTEMNDFNNEQIHFTKIYLFLHRFGQPHFLLENKPKPSLQILWYIKVLVKISDIPLIISHPLFENILFNSTARSPKFSKQFQEDLYNSVWPPTSRCLNKISSPIPGGLSQLSRVSNQSIHQ